MNRAVPGPAGPAARLRSLVAVTASMALTAMVFGFSWPMFSTRLAEMGIEEGLIGVNTAAQGWASSSSPGSPRR